MVQEDLIRWPRGSCQRENELNKWVKMMPPWNHHKAEAQPKPFKIVSSAKRLSSGQGTHSAEWSLIIQGLNVFSCWPAWETAVEGTWQNPTPAATAPRSEAPKWPPEGAASTQRSRQHSQRAQGHQRRAPLHQCAPTRTSLKLLSRLSCDQYDGKRCRSV